MRIDIGNGAVRLARGQTLKVHDGAGSLICAREGSVWVTEENSRKDVVLESGTCIRLENPGLTLVQAFTEASVSLAAA